MSSLMPSPAVTTRLLSGWHFAKRHVDSIGESPQQEDGTIQGSDDDNVVEAVHPTMMDAVAVLGVGGSLVTLALTDGHIVDAASYMTMGMAPYCAYQKRSLKELGGMRGQQNQLRQHVNELQTENNKLTGSIDQLESSVNKLEDVEAALSQLAKHAQTDSNRLIQICTEMADIQKKIKTNLESSVLQSVMEAMCQADRNRDFTLNPQEREMLVMRLKNLPGIELDEPNFTKMVGTADVKLSDLMKMLRNLKDDGIPENDNIFHLTPTSILKK